MEANPDQAVVWSKPADVEIDLNDPLANLGKAKRGGFHIGMCDGSVRFIAANIDPELFRKLLTCEGGEVIDAWD